MQEQKLRRRWKLASQHHGWMQEEPISIAFAALLVSVSYSSLLSKPLYLLINEVILVCQLFYLCQFVSKRVSQCSSLILSYTEERSHEHVYLSYNNVFLHYLFSPPLLLLLLFRHKMQGTLLLIKGPFCILSIKSCLIIITTVCQWNK